MATIVSYTPEQTQLVVEQYQAGVAVEQIALTIGKSVRSVVAKLAREKVYVAKQTEASGRGRVLTKLELAEQLEARFAIPPGTLASLEKATLPALQALEAATRP